MRDFWTSEQIGGHVNRQTVSNVKNISLSEKIALILLHPNVDSLVVT